jgi:hypothetical protein
MRLSRTLVLALALVFVSGASASAPAHWRPPAHLTWYWQLQGRVNNSLSAAAYDVDGFGTSAREVARLHAEGKHVICYIDVGTWENWRPDANQFPPSVLGKHNGWPGERWLDIRQPIVRQIMARRFRQQCQGKSFDAIEPDNIDGYQNSTGFPLTSQDQLSFDEWVARRAHSLGLAVLQKNDAQQSKALQPYFDGVLDEQCNQYHECSAFLPYLAAGKPVLNAEYQLSTGQFCAHDRALGIMGVRYNLALNGRRYQPCW